MDNTSEIQLKIAKGNFIIEKLNKHKKSFG
jgi:hypothetical protein